MERTKTSCEFRIDVRYVEKDGKTIPVPVDGCDIVGDGCANLYNKCDLRETTINQIKEGKILKSLLQTDFFDYSQPNSRAPQYLELIKKLSGQKNSSGATVWAKKILPTTDPVKRKEILDSSLGFGHITKEEYEKRLKEDSFINGKCNP